MFAAFLLTLAATAAASDLPWHPAVDQAQLIKIRRNSPRGLMSISSGKPVTYSEVNSTLNKRLLLNPYFMDVITNHIRERIPEREIFAKGTGAFGYFEVTHDISHICKAKLFDKVGKRTPVAVRFSLAGAERGGSDLKRGVRGFALKFYTEDGNFDLPGINFPVFFTKNPNNFVKFSYALKKHPAFPFYDPVRLWDLIVEYPESINLFLRVFGDNGIPKSYRHIAGYNIHTLQVVNKQGQRSYFRVTCIPDAGIKHLETEEAEKINVMDFDYCTRDLFNTIKNRDYPSWTVYIQTVSEADLKKYGWDVFDTTRVLPKNQFPLQPLGKIVLNRNAINHFAEIELLVFSPSNLVDGIEGAPDKLYEARRFAYTDAALYRLGPNIDMVSVNCPFNARGGYSDLSYEDVDCKSSQKSGLLKIKEKRPYTFDQASEFYEKEMSEGEKTRLYKNIIRMLKPAKPSVRQKVLALFTTVNPVLGKNVARGFNATMTY